MPSAPPPLAPARLLTSLLPACACLRLCAAPTCCLQEQFLDGKVLIFHKRRRKNSRRLRGHRQVGGWLCCWLGGLARSWEPWPLPACPARPPVACWASNPPEAPSAVADPTQAFASRSRSARAVSSSGAASHTAPLCPTGPTAPAAAADDASDPGCPWHCRSRGRGGSGSSGSSGGGSSRGAVVGPGCLPVAMCAQPRGQSCGLHTRCKTLNKNKHSGHQGGWLGMFKNGGSAAQRSERGCRIAAA